MKKSFRGQTRLRSWMLKLHLYGGLICSSYLIIYGISSLSFNHPFSFMQRDRAAVTWTRTLSLPDEADDLRLAEQTRDALGLFGWPLPWTMRRDDGDLRFELARPGKRYQIRIATTENKVYVEEHRLRPWAILRALHGLSEEVPGSRFLRLWSVFTELSTWIVVFSALSGVYLWTFRRKERRVGGVLTLGAAAGTIGLILFLLLRG